MDCKLKFTPGDSSGIDSIKHCLMIPYRYKQTSLEKVVRNCIKNADVRSLVVTVSGGADSVALIAALSSLSRYLSINALHCNFHLRGEESNRDQASVENLCRNLNLPLFVKDFDVEAYMQANKGVSVEMACRELRYEWFRNMKAELGAERIATGHNADDNIETLLLNLLRGSGTTGLKGMLCDTGEIIRPLLSIHRSEIISYLSQRDLSYVTDSSNLTSDYRRNFLRNEVLPLIRSRWAGADKALDRSISLLQSENRLVEEAVRKALPPSGHPLLRDTVLSFPAPELLIRRYLLPLSPLTTTPAEVLAAMRADKPDIKRWQLPGGTAILRASRLSIHPS